MFLDILGVMLRNSPKYAVLRLPNKLPRVSVLQDLKLLSALPPHSFVFPLISPTAPFLKPRVCFSTPYCIDPSFFFYFYILVLGGQLSG